MAYSTQLICIPEQHTSLSNTKLLLFLFEEYSIRLLNVYSSNFNNLGVNIWSYQLRYRIDKPIYNGNVWGFMEFSAS